MQGNATLYYRESDGAHFLVHDGGDISMVIGGCEAIPLSQAETVELSRMLKEHGGRGVIFNKRTRRTTVRDIVVDNGPKKQ